MANSPPAKVRNEEREHYKQFKQAIERDDYKDDKKKEGNKHGRTFTSKKN